MWQWLIGILIIVLIIGGVWWWLNPGKKISTSDLVSGITSWEDKVLGTKEETINNLREVPLDLANQTKTDIQHSITNSASSINQTLDSVLGIKNLNPSQEVVVNIVTPGPTANSNLLTFDMSQSQNLHLKLAKNTKYLMKFNNIPAGFCLYIINNQYKLSGDQLLEMSFANSGTFPIKMDKCETSVKNLGEFVVE